PSPPAFAPTAFLSARKPSATPTPSSPTPSLPSGNAPPSPNPSACPCGKRSRRSGGRPTVTGRGPHHGTSGAWSTSQSTSTSVVVPAKVSTRARSYIGLQTTQSSDPPASTLPAFTPSNAAHPEALVTALRVPSSART